MSDPPQSPHDALFRHVFWQPENAADELRHVLPAQLVQAIDWPTLEVLPGTWIDANLRASHADLLSVRLAHRPALVYVLLEHKSQVEPFTAFQILVYMVRIWQQHRREHPEATTLPPILPVVVHHSAHGWTGSTRFAALLDLDPGLRDAMAPFVPDFRFALDDLAAVPDDKLQVRAMSAVGRLALFCLKRARHSGDLLGELLPWAHAFRAVLAAERGADALAAGLSYIMRVPDVPPQELRRFLASEVGSTAESSLMSIADEIERRAAKTARDKALAEGWAKGRAEGQADGRVEILIRQLTKRFGELPEAVGHRVRRASIDQLDGWAERVLSAASLDEVFAGN